MAVMMTAATSFTACNNQEEALTNVAGGEIRFSSQVMTSRVVGQNTQNTAIASGVNIAIFAQNESNSFLANANNAPYTADGNGGLTAVSTAICWPSEGDVNFYAYAPHQASWDFETAQSFTVNRDQSSEANYLASDLLYAQANNPVSNPTTVVLPFSHKLSKINITVLSNDNSVDLQGATVTLLNVMPTITFTPSDGSLGAASGSASSIKMATFADDETTFNCSAIIVPQTLSGEFVQVTLADGTNYQCSLSAPKTVASNQAYAYTLTIDVESIQISASTTLADWDSNDEGNLGLDKIITFEVGDYLLANGTFVKNADGIPTGETAIGVIFSTEVSTTDASNGYTGYVLGFEASSGNWATTASLVEEYPSPSTAGAAYYELEGLAATAYYATEGAANYPLFDTFNDNLTTGLGSEFSEWFIPSVGQWFQILENLAAITFTPAAYVNEKFQIFPNATADEVAAYNAPSKAAIIDNQPIGNTEILAKLNAYAAIANKTIASGIYATSTQRNSNNVWLVALRNSENGSVENRENSWEITAGGQTSSRNVLPVIAFKSATAHNSSN